MFYMSPFMLSESSDLQQEAQQNQQFDASLSQDTSLSHESCDPAKMLAPLRNESNDFAQRDSYTVAFDRLTQSFFENAQIYQKAHSMFQDQMTVTTSNDSSDILQIIVNDRETNLVNAATASHHIASHHTSSNNISSDQNTGNNNDYISLFYSLLSDSPFDHYRDLTTSLVETTLSPYTNGAMQSMCQNMYQSFLSQFSVSDTSRNTLYSNLLWSPFAQKPAEPLNWFSFFPMSNLLSNHSMNNLMPLSVWSLPAFQQWINPTNFANPLLQMWQQVFSQGVNVSFASPFKSKASFSWFPQVKTQSLTELYMNNCQAALESIWSMLKSR